MAANTFSRLLMLLWLVQTASMQSRFTEHLTGWKGRRNGSQSINQQWQGKWNSNGWHSNRETPMPPSTPDKDDEEPWEGMTVELKVRNFEIPPRMIYTLSNVTFFKYPVFSRSGKDAAEVLESYVRYAVEDAIEKQLFYEGLEGIVSKALRRVNIEGSYKPLECEAVFVDREYYLYRGTSYWKMSSEDSTAKNVCFINGKKIIGYCSCADLRCCKNGGANIDKVHRKYKATLEVQHRAFATWNEHKWELVMKSAQRNLRNGVYHNYFALAEID